MEQRETIILSLGGSLIVPPQGIDTKFLIDFSQFIRKQIAKNRRFFIICGGGATARNYIDAGATVIGKSIKNDDKDWLGIHSTRLNAHLVRTIFRDVSNPVIIEHYDQDYDIENASVIVCSGWKPGWSTDYCSVLVAERYGAKTVINMSNIDKVYDKDPRKFKDALPIEKTTWDFFETLVGNSWTPGLNAPFDPIATQSAKRMKLNVIILNGKNIRNLEAAIEGHKFTGTVIAPYVFDSAFYDRDYYDGGKGVYAGKLFKATSHIRALYRALVIAFIFRPKTLLDVGCGLGFIIHYLRMFGVEAYGVEISNYAAANALPSVRQYIKDGDVRNLPFKDKEFDMVTSFDVLEHIHREDLTQAISECARVSKRYQFHKIFTKENYLLSKLHGTDLSHVSVMPKRWWEDLWRKHELKVVNKWWPKLPRALATTYLLEK